MQPFHSDNVISRQMMGESLSNLTVKELKSLEIKLEKGISKIRSKKVSLPCFHLQIYEFCFTNNK